MRELEAENTAGSRNYWPDIHSGCRGIEGSLEPKALTPQAKREAVTVMQQETPVSERRASRTVLHYEPKMKAENEQLQQRITEIAGERRRFGYRRIHALLHCEGVSFPF